MKFDQIDKITIHNHRSVSRIPYPVSSVQCCAKIVPDTYGLMLCAFGVDKVQNAIECRRWFKWCAYKLQFVINMFNSWTIYYTNGQWLNGWTAECLISD